MRRLLRLGGIAGLTVLPLLTASPALADTVASLGDASIAHDIAARSWTLAAGGASMVLAIDPAEDYALTALVSPSGVNWIQARSADTVVTVNGVPRMFGSRSDGFAYSSASASSNGQRLELDATFVLVSQSLSVTRHIAVAPGSPTFEVWTTLQALGNPVTLSNLDAFQAVVSPGAVNWVTGEQPLTHPPVLDSEFQRRQQILAANQTLSFGSVARSSEATVPWVAVDGAADEFYAALMWSGGWSLTLARTGTGLSMDWGLGTMSTVAGAAPLEGPHALIGVARGALPAATAALRTYVFQGLRGGRPMAPLVTYNTWFAYGTAVDEPSMLREMAREASMGVELFVIDAGWYTGADTSNITDFTPGLGTWTVDADRFPDGLTALSAAAHGLGMKFGVWVEPERVDLNVIGQNGLDESSLATAGGNYGANSSALICLAGQAGQQWVVDHLTAFIDAVQPDYLKWDNNLWVNCDREGHGHGPGDGSFAHNTALYGILAMLRQRYPSLVIENCSGGGNRLDFGILRYTDAAWMNDQTSPSERVRHDVEGLGLVFPPAYLLSFLPELGWEPLDDSPDLPMYARSRMEGVFGLSFRSPGFSDSDLSAIAAQITFYKRLRPILATAATTLLTAQATSAATDWDVLQESGTDGRIVLFAVKGVAAAPSTLVSPVNLQATADYRVISIEDRAVSVRTGADLMANGITLNQSPTTAAQILLLIPRP
jgi:alpha-galactosidase